MFGFKPNFISAKESRKIIGISVKKGENAKKIVLKFHLDNTPGFVVSCGKRGGTPPAAYDMADAITVARAGYERQKANSMRSAGQS